MNDTFRARLIAREKLLGTMATLTTPASAEILADLGFDWLFIDGEHGPLETAELLSILQAVDHKVASIVRVPSADEVAIKKVLDLGATGIIVPQVNSAEQAADVVRWARYAPAGSRGVGLARAHGYGMKFAEYIESANDNVAVIVQAEHADAVENIEHIAAVEGVDAVLLGPYDLSASMGIMGQLDNPIFTAAIDRITEVCLAAEMPSRATRCSSPVSTHSSSETPPRTCSPKCRTDAAFPQKCRILSHCVASSLATELHIPTSQFQSRLSALAFLKNTPPSTIGPVCCAFENDLFESPEKRRISTSETCCAQTPFPRLQTRRLVRPSLRSARQKGSPTLSCSKNLPHPSFTTIRHVGDPATHRPEQSRRAPFVVAIASVLPPGGPYRW